MLMKRFGSKVFRKEDVNVCTLVMLNRLTRRRNMSTDDTNDRENPPRSKQFYEDNSVLRNYFYFMDNRGRLFLEETRRRNMATCMKDAKFLDFTIRNMKPNNTGSFLEMDSFSLCGKERNFIAHADRLSPFTFKEKVVSVDSNSQILRYGGTLQQEYNPELLAFHPTTGRIYHLIIDHKYYNGRYGLLHPHLCQELGESITYDDDMKQFVYYAPSNNCIYPLKDIG